MSLATRCSACGTVFRVVEDQLKVSDGWVRCGRCDTVFDALEGMIDTEQQHPSDTAPPGLHPPAQTDVGRPVLSDDEPVDIHHLLSRKDASSDVADGRTEPEFGPAEDVQPANAAPAAELADAAAAPGGPDLGLETARPLPDDQQPLPDPAPALAEHYLKTTPEAAAADLPPPISPGPRPSFLQQSEREVRWNSPAMRAALIGSSLILSLMLVLQVVYHQRDSIAANSTLLGDWLRSACLRWDCSIEPPRDIRAVTIENSALTQLAGQPQTARLSLTMRNRSGGELTMPSVELSLTDFEGKLIARRALMPGDFQVDPPVLAANSELPLQIDVSAADRRIAGYTVELFYP